MPEPVALQVINLARRQDRRAAMRARLEGLGLNAGVFTAIDARFMPEMAPDQRPGLRDPYPLSPAAHACALSHLAVWRAFLESDASVLCVLEDDVRLDASFAPILRHAPALMGDVQVMKLDLVPIGKSSILVSDIRKTSCDGYALKLGRLWSRQFGAGCYMLRRDAARRLCACGVLPRLPVDHLLFNPVHSPLFRDPGVHVALPFPAWHDAEASDIEPERRAERNSPGRWRLKLARELDNARAIPGRARAMLRGARWIDVARAALPPSGNTH